MVLKLTSTIADEATEEPVREECHDFRLPGNRKANVCLLTRARLCLRTQGIGGVGHRRREDPVFCKSRQ